MGFMRLRVRLVPLVDKVKIKAKEVETARIRAVLRFVEPAPAPGGTCPTLNLAASVADSTLFAVENRNANF